MNLLVLHPNYPGQLGRLAAALAEREGWKVAAIGRGPREPERVLPAHYTYYEKYVSGPETDFPPIEAFGQHVRQGRAVAERLQSLRDKGFQPDVIFAHPGWGETMFLRDVYPRARFVAYLEYFYRKIDSDVDFDPEFPAPDHDLQYVSLRNATNLLAFAAADDCVTPTHWQASGFPPNIRQALTVLHEGVETGKAVPKPDAALSLPGGGTVSRSDEILTYVARSLEPYRGFHVVMRLLPELLQQRPHLKVLVVGNDGVSYGRSPGDAMTWRQKMLEEVGDRVDLSRVFFLGQLPYADYLNVLQVSTVHLYLTYPFVLSWSLLEAMSIGCAVVASSTGPADEVIEHGKNGRLCGFFDREALVSCISGLLDDRVEAARLGAAARQSIISRYDFDTLIYPRYRAFLSGDGQAVQGLPLGRRD